MIYHKETGKHVEEAIHRLFDRLKLTLSKKIAKERKEYLYKRKKQRLANLNENVADLQELKREKKQDVFKNLVGIVLNDLAAYMRRRLHTAERTTAISKGRYKIHELLDEIYLKIYDCLDEMPEDKNKINTWIYHLADELLEEKFQEAEFEKENFKQLAGIVESEYKSLDEQYTLDAEGNPIPVEDLDEGISTQDRYHAENLIFDENEDSFLDEISLRLNKNIVHYSIERELAKLPVRKRSVMDLYLINQMTEEEISEVKEIPLEEVKDIITEVNEEVKLKLRDLL